MTRTFYVEVSCRVSGSIDDFEDHLDTIMEALEEEPGVSDADIGARLEDMHVDFCLHLEADAFEEAFTRAVTVVRSALHAAGAATPGWERVTRAVDDDEIAVSARPADLSTA